MTRCEGSIAPTLGSNTGVGVGVGADVASAWGFVTTGVGKVEAPETLLAQIMTTPMTTSVADRASSTDVIVTVIFLRLV